METGCSVMEDPEQLVLKDMKEAEDGVQTELEHAESSNSRPVADMSDEYRCAMAGRGARDVFKDDDDEEEGGFFLTGTDMEEIVQKEANGDKSEEDHEEAVGGNVRIEAVEEADEREEGGGEQEVAEDEEGEESPSQRFRRMDGVEEEKAREDEEDEDEDQDGDIEFVDSEVRRRFRNIILQRGVEETGEETTAMEPRGDEGTQLGKTQAQDADLMEEEEEEEETAGEERYEENKAMQEELEVRRSRVESIHGELEEYVSYLHSKKLEEEDEPLVTFPDNYAEVLADEEAKVIESQEGFATARGDGLGSSGEHAASSIAESEEEEQVNKAREKMRRLDKLLGDKLRASRRIRLEGEASASAARILAKSEDERGAHVRADSRDTQLEGRPRSSAAAVKRALSSRERGGGELEKLTAKYGSRLGLTEEQDKRVELLLLDSRFDDANGMDTVPGEGYAVTEEDSKRLEEIDMRLKQLVGEETFERSVYSASYRSESNVSVNSKQDFLVSLREERESRERLQYINRRMQELHSPHYLHKQASAADIQELLMDAQRHEVVEPAPVSLSDLLAQLEASRSLAASQGPDSERREERGEGSEEGRREGERERASREEEDKTEGMEEREGRTTGGTSDVDGNMGKERREARRESERRESERRESERREEERSGPSVQQRRERPRSGPTSSRTATKGMDRQGTRSLRGEGSREVKAFSARRRKEIQDRRDEEAKAQQENQLLLIAGVGAKPSSR